MNGIISKELELEYNYICRKMKNFINIVDIINWMNNFEQSDRKDMLELLNRFRFFSDAELIEGYKNLITDIVCNNSNHTIFVHPIGAYGKSGTAMIYFFKKAVDAVKVKKSLFKYVPNINIVNEYSDKSNIKLILLDDFLGSGQSAQKYYDKIYDSIKEIKDVYIMSFICMDKAEKLLKDHAPGIVLKYCELETPVFSTTRNTLGNREKIKRIRNIAYKYSYNNKLGIRNSDYLGYENSQCLIGFSFGTPNNTLPIFWNANNRWFALFPRFAQERISKIVKLRKNLFHELAYAYMFGDGFFIKADERLDKKTKIEMRRIDYCLLVILKFKVQRKSDITICRLLGITMKDYEKSIKLAFDKGLLDSDSNLTEVGKNLYNNIMENIRKYKSNYEKNNLYGDKVNSIYVPSSFGGKT